MEGTVVQVDVLFLYDAHYELHVEALRRLMQCFQPRQLCMSHLQGSQWVQWTQF